MKNYTKKTLQLTVASIAFIVCSSQSVQATVCGPGDHWVDSCAAGTDNLANISGVFALEFIGLGLFVIPVDGMDAVITTTAAFDSPDALDPGHNNQINTELLSATLFNIDPVPGAGNVTVRVGTDSGVSTPSTGAIIEMDDPSLAYSYFDIYFEVDTALGTFHNDDPLRISAIIDSWNTDVGVFYEIDLLYGLPQVLNSEGFAIANTLTIDGVTGLTLGTAVVPVPSAVYLFGSGLLGLFGFMRKRKQQV